MHITHREGDVDVQARLRKGNDRTCGKKESTNNRSGETHGEVDKVESWFFPRTIDEMKERVAVTALLGLIYFSLG